MKLRAAAPAIVISAAPRPGQDPVAVISHAYWKRRFSASPSVIGQTMEVKGIPFTIVGVTPPRFFE